ncbi:MAG: hypothetical protein OEY06_07805 [Gammaproteobacteria bacterium]|nr:hypothetical protein [Gammaproteobacteria bacterium]
MKKLITVASAISALILINGCSSDSATTTAAAGSPISVITISGSTVSLDGSYSTGCVDRTLEGGSGWYKDDMTIAGSTLNTSSAEYSDIACTVETGAGTVEATLAVGTDSAITGWIGAGDAGGTFIPTASDGSGPLGLTEAVTMLTATVVSGTGWNASLPAGTVIDLFYVVDDTGTNKVLYEDDDAFGGSTLANNIASTQL